MSGGSMDYLHRYVRSAPFEDNTSARRALRKHLAELAEVLRKIEWNDSGDGAEGEDEAIRECIGGVAVLDCVIEEAKQATKALQFEQDWARKWRKGNKVSL